MSGQLGPRRAKRGRIGILEAKNSIELAFEQPWKETLLTLSSAVHVNHRVPMQQMCRTYALSSGSHRSRPAVPTSECALIASDVSLLIACGHSPFATMRAC